MRVPRPARSPSAGPLCSRSSAGLASATIATLLGLFVACAEPSYDSSPYYPVPTADGGAAAGTGGGFAGSPAGEAGASSGGVAGEVSGGAPGVAGCAANDVACNDACPDDPEKTEPGSCGCGTAETDSDEDGVADCQDECPSDPERTKLGPCGCGVDFSKEPSCTALKNAIKHRYAFNGTGSSIADAIGTANGTLVNTTLANSGALTLQGEDQYVDLPNGIISSLSSLTIEVWVTWRGGNQWQRIFDFGDDSTGVEDSRGTGGGYLFLSPKGNGDFLRFCYRKKGQNEVVLDQTPALVVGEKTHLAVVVDGAADVMQIYRNGALANTGALAEPLSEINDVNTWIGRSQFAADPGLNGEIDEFRVYSEALPGSLVKFSFETGPDADFLRK